MEDERDIAALARHIELPDRNAARSATPGRAVAPRAELNRPPLVRIRPRPRTQYVSQGRAVLATEQDGFIRGDPEHGLFVHQTRLLSKWRWRMGGFDPYPVACGNVDQHSWLGYYLLADPADRRQDEGSGAVPLASQHALELRISRYVGNGMHEDVDLTNYTGRPVRVRLDLEADADFLDQEERRGRRRQHGERARHFREDGAPLRIEIDYRAAHAFRHPGEEGRAEIHRGASVRISRSDSPPRPCGSGVSFDVRLEPARTWHACFDVIAMIESEILEPEYGCRSFVPTPSPLDAERERYLAESTSFEAGPPGLCQTFVAALEQARRDLGALRLHDLDEGERAWTVAAGLPTYVALFGRDALTAAWQAAIGSLELLRGTLPRIARYQGTRRNDWRDEQPGRMLHEAHTGPLAALNFNPRSRYYGSVTTSGFFPVALAELWHWTGDRERVGPLIDPALRAIRWLDEWSDLDRDGFYEYKTRSPQGVENQAWKDSGDAIVYEDGTLVRPPIATCEEQGFAYLAKLHMSEVLWWFGRRDEARRLFREAKELRKRFREAFWMEDEGFVALALDSHKRPVRSITSNPGHCLATAIVDRSQAARVADRLMADDLFSGWGVRTLSSEHPAYNPYSYHRGSVWPVEQGTFAIAFMRYGLWGYLERLVRGQLEAAQLFELSRLPEVLSGHPRDADHPFPAVYPQSNSPQAWSASAVFCFVQAMLGLYPYAPLRLLVVDPHLPEWMPELTVRGLHVGRGVVNLRFKRLPTGASDWEILERRGPIHVIRQASPWSLTATWPERVRDALASLIP